MFFGEMAEWLKAHAWKACVGKPTAGSNPVLSAKILILFKYILFMNKKLLFFFLIWLAIFLFVVGLNIFVDPLEKSIVSFDNVDVVVEIADEDLERRKGLMFRESLLENEGMIFVYDKSQKLTFWMKNTLIPLDMIWIDENSVVQHIEYAVPCETEICDIYGWDGFSKYLLEVNGGFTEKYDINVGDKVLIKT